MPETNGKTYAAIACRATSNVIVPAREGKVAKVFSLAVAINGAATFYLKSSGGDALSGSSSNPYSTDYVNGLGLEPSDEPHLVAPVGEGIKLILSASVPASGHISYRYDDPE